MARQKRINPDSWMIAQDKETDEILIFQQSDPEAKTATGRRRYIDLGNLNKLEDAEAFQQYKELGIAPDAVAFLCTERRIRTLDKARSNIDEEALNRLINDVRVSSGRTCFGTCKSLQGAPACAICFGDLRDTWNLCATIQCLHCAGDPLSDN